MDFEGGAARRAVELDTIDVADMEMADKTADTGDDHVRTTGPDGGRRWVKSFAFEGRRPQTGLRISRMPSTKCHAEKAMLRADWSNWRVAQCD